MRHAAQKVIDVWLGDCTGHTDWAALNDALESLQTALKHPLTDGEISILWHESGGQPFKFARMVQDA